MGILVAETINGVGGTLGDDFGSEVLDHVLFTSNELENLLGFLISR
jgi:hypothetical protein